jgi:hypothetical protein
MARDRREKEGKIQTSIKIRPDIYARVMEFGKSNNRSFSNATEVLLLIAFNKIEEREQRIADMFEAICKRIDEIEKTKRKSV